MPSAKSFIFHLKSPKRVILDQYLSTRNMMIFSCTKKVLDKILQALGCAIEDLIDKLVSWLTNLLFDFIMEIFSPAACAISSFRASRGGVAANSAGSTPVLNTLPTNLAR